MTWRAIGKVRWPPPVADANVIGEISDSRVGGVIGELDGLPLLGCALTGIPTVGHGERAQVGFVWVKHWRTSSNPTLAQAKTHLANYPSGGSTFAAPDATTLTGEVWEFDVPFITLARLDIPVLQGYSSAVPLNLMGAANVDGPREPWARFMAYADASFVHMRAQMPVSPAGGDRDSGWKSWPIGDGFVYTLITATGETVTSYMEFALNDGLDERGPWG